MTARIFVKLIAAVVLVMVVALTTIDFLASKLAEEAYTAQLREELEEKLRMVGVMSEKQLLSLSPETVHDLAGAAGGRLSIINRDGRVVVDSEADPARMGNHGGRAEVKAALDGKTGFEIRKSGTLGINYLYVAGPVAAGAARLAVPLKAISGQVAHIRAQLLLYTALAFVPAILLAAFFARYFSEKLGAIIDYADALARGDFKTTLKNIGTDELGMLGSKLTETGTKLQGMFKELEKEHVEMEKLERIRKDFVINVSHELRTPLASIQGYTETLLDGALYDPENNVRFLNIVRQNAERLGRLTGDLLTISRVELKTQKFQFASYYVNSLLADCVDSMRLLADKKQITLEVQQAPDDTEVFCDAEAVHQIMSNLLDNAIKYTPEGGRITVSAQAVQNQAGETESVDIAVSDTGIGVPAEDLPRLFERFYRVDKARSRELGGTGLGLAIVKHLTRAHGGDVRVDSVLGKGSTFAFTLPTTINASVIAS